MDRNKLQRLNLLFEKMVETKATQAESKELSWLYLEYINDGREINKPSKDRMQSHSATA